MCADNTQHESLVNSSFFVVKLRLVWFCVQGTNLVNKDNEKKCRFCIRFFSNAMELRCFLGNLSKGFLYRFTKNFINIFSSERQENLQLT